MTKVTILGEETQRKNSKKKTKKIKFKKALTNDLNIENFKPHNYKPNEYKNIELIASKIYNGFDLMYCYNDDRNCSEVGVIVLGHFNDGVV